jgi:ATP adenylyltransferase
MNSLGNESEIGARICCLCSGMSAGDMTEFWNRPLIETTNFVVLPSLGALVEGWVLIVPRDHLVAIAALPDELLGELILLKSEIYNLTERIYGTACIFEHGPATENRLVGCGVDHAHLHIAPVAFDLAEAVSGFLPPAAEWREATHEECRDVHGHGLDYLYVEQQLGSGQMSMHREFGSQLFRKAIAAHLGIADQFSWRSHPQIENVVATIARLSPALYAETSTA